ncbi:MAG: methylated-DNA--[protein]-cysteine S-methyltransferase [Comamonas sp.]
MNHPFASSFEYHFRAPGSRVQGPLRFAMGQAAPGLVLVGRSRHGICAILLGDDAQALQEQLGEAFPGAALQADQPGLQHELQQVVDLLDRGWPAGIVHLDVGGTAFEQQVWQALCGIPAGHTRSYREVAQGLGAPQAFRAVAGACASNVLAVAIPCHRVLRSDGSAGGYRWGIERKRALLAWERGQ